MNDPPRSVRLNRTSRNPKIKLGFLVASSVRRTQSNGETLAPLLTTHFPNSEIYRSQRYLRPPFWLDVPTGGWLRGWSHTGE
jgi:hypothetical protein